MLLLALSAILLLAIVAAAAAEARHTVPAGDLPADWFERFGPDYNRPTAAAPDHAECQRMGVCFCPRDRR